MGDGEIRWQTFRRQIPWYLLLWPVIWLGIWLARGADGGASSALEYLGMSVLLGVILGPLVWVRWARKSTSRQRNLMAAGLAFGWAVVTGLATAVVWSLVT
jgi:hypothetical protein